ncbi:MAG: NPCBM/NEW2 domain-containing protein [bacterium]
MKKELGILIAVIVALCAFGVWQWARPTTVYLSELDYEVPSWNWTEPKKDQSIDGNPIRIADHIYACGISTHATTEIQVDVPRGYRRFIAEVGVDAQVRPDGPSSVRFFVYGDRSLLYESPVMRAMDTPRRVDVWVDEIHTLSLLSTDAGDGNNSDHADWADAKFVR